MFDAFGEIVPKFLRTKPFFERNLRLTAGSKPLMDRAKLHSLDQWHHVAMVYDGSEFRHYVDGKLQGNASVTLTPMAAGKTSIGVRMNKVDYFKGAIRLARMTKHPLTVDEFLKVR